MAHPACNEFKAILSYYRLGEPEGGEGIPNGAEEFKGDPGGGGGTAREFPEFP